LILLYGDVLHKTIFSSINEARKMERVRETSSRAPWVMSTKRVQVTLAL